MSDPKPVNSLMSLCEKIAAQRAAGALPPEQAKALESHQASIKAQQISPKTQAELDFIRENLRKNSHPLKHDEVDFSSI